MNLTNREKIMLILLACTAIIALGYIYIITPELTRLDTVKEENSKVTNEVNQVKSMISQSNPINKNLEDAIAKAGEKSARLYPELVQDRLILIIDDVIKKTGLQVDGINFTGIKAGDILIKKPEDSKLQYQLKDLAKAYTSAEEKKQGQSGTNQGQQSNGNQNAQTAGSQTPQKNNTTAAVSTTGQNSVESAGMTLQIKGDYDQISRLITELEALKRAVLIDNITVSNSTTGLTGTANITFYGAAKIPGTDTLFGEWLYKNEYGKANPFK